MRRADRAGTAPRLAEREGAAPGLANVRELPVRGRAGTADLVLAVLARTLAS